MERKSIKVVTKEGTIVLYGRYEHTVDAKNRMFVPAKFKEALGQSFKVTCNPFSKCILVYSNEEWEKYEAKLSTLPSLQYEDIIRIIYSNTVDIQLDSQGRMVIPQFLKDKVEIQKNVFVMGVGTRLEIWAQEVYEEKEKAIDLDKMKEHMIQFGF